jgi:hypothetical protein
MGKSFATGVGKKVQVTFIAMDNGNYEMRIGDEIQDQLVFNKDKHQINGKPMSKADYFLIDFVLNDETTVGNLCVPPNPMEAFWVCTPAQQDPPICPKDASYDCRIFAVSTDPKHGILTVRNEDMSCFDFQFTLRFLPDRADPNIKANYVPYDPGGINQNGGSKN